MAFEFEQLPGESAKAFAAFSVYLSLGPERSLAAVGQRLGKSVALLERWSARWRWAERVATHAAHFAVVEREAAEALARSKAAEWLKRAEALRESEWEMHEKCIAAAKRAFEAFMAREKVYANLADMSRMLEVASKLGRLASGMATDKTELTGEEGGPIRVELSAALERVYGKVVDVEATPVASDSKLPIAQGDIDAYLGLEYDVIGIEEATTLSSRKHQDISTCSRTSKPNWRPRIYSTTNPGGIGHAWYRAKFIVPCWQGKESETRFIPARVGDNRFSNPEYTRVLQRLGDPDAGIRPTMFVHRRCARLLECLPTLQHDPHRPEDVLKIDADEEGVGGDDAADACRYLVATKARELRQRKLAGV